MKRRAEKVAIVGVERSRDWLYFLSAGGDIMRARRVPPNPSADFATPTATMGQHELVHALGIQREEGWLYFIDSDGDVSRGPMRRIV